MRFTQMAYFPEIQHFIFKIQFYFYFFILSTITFIIVSDYATRK